MAAVGVGDEVGQKRAVPLSILLDLGGLEVEARKNILRALKDSYAREMRLRTEVQRLREQLGPERADPHPLPGSVEQRPGVGLHEGGETERKIG